MGRPAAAVMRHLLPRPFGVGGEERIAWSSSAPARSAPSRRSSAVSPPRIPRAIGATSTRCALPTPTRKAALSPTAPDGGEPASDLANRLRATFGPVNVDAIAAYVLAVLSAPSFRSRYSAELAIDHPRIPFPADAEPSAEWSRSARSSCRRTCWRPTSPTTYGSRCREQPIDEIRFDDAGSAVWINQGQRFTGIALAAWNWGGSFRPLEHWLSDRRGRALDFAQIQQFQHSIQASGRRSALSLRWTPRWTRSSPSRRNSGRSYSLVPHLNELACVPSRNPRPRERDLPGRQASSTRRCVHRSSATRRMSPLRKSPMSLGRPERPESNGQTTLSGGELAPIARKKVIARSSTSTLVITARSIIVSLRRQRPSEPQESPVFAHDLDNPHHLVPSVSLVRGNTDSRIQPDLGFTTATALHMEWRRSAQSPMKMKKRYGPTTSRVGTETS